MFSQSIPSTTALLVRTGHHPTHSMTGDKRVVCFTAGATWERARRSNQGGRAMDFSFGKASAVTVLGAGGLALAVGAVALVQSAQQLDREGKIVVAAGNPQYVELAERYKKDLRKYGVQLEVRERTTFKDKEGRISVRPLEGRLTLRRLTENDSGITAGFVKGDLVASLQGRLATEKQKDRHEEYSKLHSVGRLFHEPIWVFTRGD